MTRGTKTPCPLPDLTPTISQKGFSTMRILLPCAAASLAIALVATQAARAAEGEKVVEKLKKVTLASIAVKDDYPEGVASEGIFGEMKPHLHELVNRLDKAAKDDKISGVVLRLREPDIGLAKVAELRAAI